jgi:YbbR domain-containing protein
VRLFPGVLSRNWQLKVSAIALAVLLWTVPRFEAPSRQTLQNVPVRVQLTDPQWALEGEPLPAQVSVTLSGPARELFALAVDQPSIVLPVDHVSAPDTAVQLLYPWLRIPEREGVLVEAMEPPSVRLAFERIAVAEVQLGIRLAGTLPANLSLSRLPVISDSLVSVRGAASRVAALDSIFLVPLDLAGVVGSGVIRLPVDTAGLNGMAISVRETGVEISVEETLELTFPDLPVEMALTDLGSSIQFRPTQAEVTLRGARSLVESIDPEQLRVRVPLSRAMNLDPGEERRVRLVVEGAPPLVEATARPELVTVRRAVGS